MNHRHSASSRATVALSGFGVAVAVLVAALWWPGEWSMGRALAAIGASLAATGATVALWRLDALSTRQVLAVAVVLRVLMLPVDPVLTDDPHRYLWDGLVQHQGIHPYAHLPTDPVPELDALRAHPAFDRMNSAEFHSVYPPLSQVLFAVGASVEQVRPGGGYLGIKLVFAALELAGLLALARLTAARHLLLYAWSPLVVVELTGQMHTEAGMVGLLLLGLLAVRACRPGLASLALAGAGWIKLYPFLLLPLLASRFGWRRLWPGLAGAVVLGAIYLNPATAANLISSLRLYVNHFEFYAGPYYLLRGGGWGLQDWLPLPDPRPIAALLLATVFAAFGLSVWWWHRRGRLSFETSAFLVLAGFLVCSTTVHPWYFAGLIALLPFIQPRWRWPWLWLAAWSSATYLRYLDGPYWPFVWIGWGGWLVAMVIAVRHEPRLAGWWHDRIDAALRSRARDKADWFSPAIRELESSGGDRPLRLLDLGAGEGWLGQELARRHGLDVHLAEVRDSVRVELPWTRIDGRRLPFADNAFDVVTLSFVLHHAVDPDQLLREAARVARHRVLVLESWSPGRWRRWLLRWTDAAVNSLRGCGWREPIVYRSPEQWRAGAAAVGWHGRSQRCSDARFHQWVWLEFAPGDALSQPGVARSGRSGPGENDRVVAAPGCNDRPMGETSGS